MISRIFHFFIFSNLFIALCAVLMVYQTCLFLLQSPPDIYFLLFVFFATICSYSFHWYLTPATCHLSPRLNWLILYRSIHTWFFIIGLVGSLVTGFFLLDHWQLLLFAALTTFLYSAPKIPHPWFRILRKVAIGKTLFLSLTWMYVTSLLPLLMSDRPWRTDFTLFAASRFFLIYAICILFDYRDREYDKSIGIRSLITWLSERAIAILFTITLLLFAITTGAMLQFDHSIVAIFVLLVPGLITGVLYPTATRNFSDIFYYFILDGLMAFSALLMLFLPNI